MKRLELAFDDEGMELIERLKLLSGLKTNKDLFNNAITLFDWAVAQVTLGRTLVSLDEQKADPQHLVMPSLQHAGRLNRNMGQKAVVKRSEAPRQEVPPRQEAQVPTRQETTLPGKAA